VLGNPKSQLLPKLEELVLVELNQLWIGPILSWDVLVDVGLYFESKAARLYGIAIDYAPVSMDPQPCTVSLLLLVLENAVIVLEIVR